jgi:hypothetical protein
MTSLVYLFCHVITISPQSPSPIIRGWYNRPVVAAVPKVPPQKLERKKVEICETEQKQRLENAGKRRNIFNVGKDTVCVGSLENILKDLQTQ